MAPTPNMRALQLYGRFVGDWDAEITAHGADGTRHIAPGEIHFGWVLEGRAVQDVWMIPRTAGSPPFPVAGNWYGSTLRVYDPTIGAWRIAWFDPGRSVFRQQIGRAHGADIVQERHDRGRRADALELYGDHRHILPLDRREQASAAAADWRRVVDARARRRGK